MESSVARRIASLGASLLLMSSCWLCLSCGGGGGIGPSSESPPAVSVSVSPSTASLMVSGTQQFTATVTGTSNSAVTWSVNGTTGGSNTVGTISSSGLYKAPATIPPGVSSITVTATSQAHPSASGSGSVSLSYPVPSVNSISPDSANVNSGNLKITVDGSGFTPVSTISFGKTALAPTFVSASELTARVPASAVAAIASFQVGVTNPSPGGGASKTSAQFQVIGGTLSITIMGLPLGGLGNVKVTGPNGYNLVITASQNLQVAAGSYTITGNAVPVGTSNYFPALASQMVTVSNSSTAPATVNYSTIIPDTTKVLDSAGITSLTVSSDHSTITLSTSSEVAKALKVGDVLASAPTAAAPNGLLVKILSVSTSGETVTATVTQATLEDAVQQGTLTVSQKLGPGNTQLNSNAPSTKRAPVRRTTRQSKSQTSSSPCIGNPYTIQEPFNQLLAQAGNAKIFLAGELDLCPTFQFDLNIVGSHVTSAMAAVSFGTEAQVNLQGSWLGEFEQTYQFTSILGDPTIVYIGDIPVLVQPTLTPFIGISGSASAGFVTGIVLDSLAEIGASYSNGEWSAIYNKTGPTVRPSTTAIDASLTAKGFAGVNAGVLLDGILTPYLAPDAYLQFDAGTNNDPWWTVTAGLEGSVGVTVSFLGVDLADYQSPELNLFSTIVGQASGPFSVAAASPALTSATPNMAPQFGPDLPIALSGSNFVPDSVAYFMGAPLATTFTDTTGISADIPATDLDMAGVFPVTVSNPDTQAAISGPVNFTVTPALGVASLSFTPSIIAAGGTTTGTVTLSENAPDGGALVSLTSSNPAALPVPASVTVLAGATSATFTATASSSIESPTQVTVTASYNNTAQMATVTINPAPITVTVSPPSAWVQTSGTRQFTATVTGTQNTSVTWSVNGATGGNSTVGTISISGLFTAPTTIPNPATVTVTATSQADTSASGSASVTVVSYIVLHSFDAGDGYGYEPSALVEATDGNFYGTTSIGGSTNECYLGDGTVFEITPTGAFTIIYSFNSHCENFCNDGANPEAPLIQATDGNLYGTTQVGGDYGVGTVFKITPSGTEAVVYNFCPGGPQNSCADGDNPETPLVQGTDSNFYGTNLGGTNDDGTIFKVTPSGALTTLYNLDVGDSPEFAGLTQGADGNLYGTTFYGGTNNNDNCGYGCGTVFKITPSGTLTTLYSFCSQAGCADGDGPLGGVVQAGDGNFYGTTWGGGASNSGTVFRITPTGTLTTLYSFCSQPGCTDGEGPSAGLVQASDGNLYGTTEITIFKITTSGTLTTLYGFCSQSGCTDGEGPTEGRGLIQASDGNFYGTTVVGGAYGYGVIFRLSGPGSPPQRPAQKAKPATKLPSDP
jgi:uncharacterized repeat protein (TIGR03803 family)